MTTREQLTEILTRIIFRVTGQHASVNYELNDYVAFVPNMPFKTYERTNSNDLCFGVLPNKATATVALHGFAYDPVFCRLMLTLRCMDLHMVQSDIGRQLVSSSR